MICRWMFCAGRIDSRCMKFNYIDFRWKFIGSSMQTNREKKCRIFSVGIFNGRMTGEIERPRKHADQMLVKMNQTDLNWLPKLWFFFHWA